MKSLGYNLKDCLGGRRILPVALLVGGRKTLVVGAGKIASRKIKLLLEAGAILSVVAPEASEEVKELACNGKLVWYERNFNDSDISDQILVHAATSSRRVNSSVLAACRSKGVLCNIVDKGWHMGDFIAPATFEWKGLTISISSGGRSCRRSRMLKELLKSHLESLESLELLIIGTDHRRLSLAERSKLHHSRHEMENIAERLSLASGIAEFFILETCNRIELVAMSNSGKAMQNFLIESMGMQSLSGDSRYVLKGFDAFLHLVHTLSGLNSQSPGETEIVSQIKDAIDRAQKIGHSGSVLRDCIDKALNASKFARKEARPSFQNGRGIASSCIARLEKIYGRLGSRRVLLVGYGQLGKIIATKLISLKARTSIIPSSERPAGVNEPLISFHPLSDFKNLIHSHDVLILAMRNDKSGYFLTKNDFHGHIPRKPFAIADLCFPPSADPEITDLSKHISLINLDDLKAGDRQSESPNQVYPDLLGKILIKSKELYARFEKNIEAWD